MSYEILYARAFIRINRGFIPMILSGSNNTYVSEWCNGHFINVRERHWWCYVPQCLKENDLSLENYIRHVESWSEGGCGDYEAFRRGSGWLTYGKLPDWFRSGCARACTIEEYRIFNPGTVLNGMIKYRPKDSSSDKIELDRCLRTTEQIEDWLDEAQARFNELRQAYSDVSISFTFPGSSKPLHGVNHVDGPVKVKQGKRYIVDYQKDKSISYGSDAQQAVVFDSVADAIDKIGASWFGRYKMTFVKAGQSGSVSEKRFVLRICGGELSERYFVKQSSRRVWTTYNLNDAKWFTREADARNCAKNLRAKFSKAQIDSFLLIDTQNDCAYDLSIS